MTNPQTTPTPYDDVETIHQVLDMANINYPEYVRLAVEALCRLEERLKRHGEI